MPRPNLTSLAAVVLAGACAGAFLGRDTAAASKNSYLQMEELGYIIAALEQRSVDPATPTQYAYSAIHGLTAVLDPHSNFLEPEDYGEMQERQEGLFYGIGVVISMRDGRITIISPMEGTPAYRLGLRAGDVIVGVNGESVEGLSLNEAVHRLRGARGSKVKVKIERESVEAPLEFDIERVELPTISVPYKFMVSDTVGLVRMSDFNRNSSHELSEAVTQLKAQGMQVLILDLRDNPGGLLQQAVEVSEFFLDEGQMIVYMKGRAPGSKEEFRARRSSPIKGMPVVVLVNRASASASEIVAGAVQDHDRGVIVGERTWGKGLVQSVYNLRDGSAMALTTAKYYTPSGRLIQREYEDYDRYFMEGWTAADSEDYRNPKLKASTDHGRPVYGGGGIAPDVVSPAPKESEMVAALRSKALFFRFGAKYAETASRVQPGVWKVSDAMLRDFRAFAEKNGAAYDDEAWKTNRDAVAQILEHEVISSGVSLAEASRIAASYDPQVQEAVRQAENAKILLEGRVDELGRRIASVSASNPSS
jgi:carboxyl-terminal processing protease